MNDGHIISILGRRGQGKTLLAYTLFLQSKNFSFFVSIKNPLYFQKNIIVYNSFKNFLNSRKYTPKIYFKFNEDDEYLRLFYGFRALKNCNIFIDEIDCWTSFSYVEPNIKWLVKYSREQNINLIFIARRPQEFNPLLLSQTDLLFSFNLANIRDLEYVKRSYSLSNDIIEKIITLPQYNFIAIGNINYIYTL